MARTTSELNAVRQADMDRFLYIAPDGRCCRQSYEENNRLPYLSFVTSLEESGFHLLFEDLRHELHLNLVQLHQCLLQGPTVFKRCFIEDVF